MLNKIIRTYILAFLSLFIFFNLDIKDSNVWIVLAQLVTFLFFSLNLLYVNNRNHSFRARTLMKNVLGISLFIVFINNLVSYYYNGNFFVYSEIDALLYHSIGEQFQMNNYNFFQAIHSVRIQEMKPEDWGMPFLVSLLYFIYPSNLVVNIFYVILSMFSAKHMYNLSKNFMSTKFAYIATLAFFTSSYIHWFNSSGLKESFMIFLVLASFDFYYQFLKKKNIRGFIITLIPLIVMLFFRPVVSFLILGGIGIEVISNLRRGGLKISLIILLSLVVIFSFSFLLEQKQRYAYEDHTTMIESKSTIIKGGFLFNYAVNTIGGFIGPLPSFKIENKTLLTFFSSGLLFRVLIGGFSLVGIYKILYHRIKSFYSITFFLLFEVLSLLYILESLELRKSLPHFPFFYIIGFWVLYQIKMGKLPVLKKRYSVFILVSIGLVFSWNLLR